MGVYSQYINDFFRAGKQNSNDNEGEIEFWTEHDRANDYIQKCLNKNQEKAAMLQIFFYFCHVYSF